jgi:hypothetical protein
MQARFAWVAIILLLVVPPALAQTNPPAYIALEGEMYVWTLGAAALEPFAACDLDDHKVLTLALSPTGAHLALNVVTPEVYTGGYAPSPTGNLWLCDLTTGVLTTLTDLDELSTSISRQAVWSPDGVRLAWGVVNPDGTESNLWIHEVETAATTVLVEGADFDYGCGVGPNPPNVMWSDAGLVAGYFIPFTEDMCLAESMGFSVYGLDGERRDLLVAFTAEQYGLGEWYAASDRVLFRLQGDETWRSIDLANGTQTDADGVPQQFVLDMGGPSIMMETGDVALPGLASVVRPGQIDTFSVGLSPDGRAALLVAGATVFAVVDGQISVVTGGSFDLEQSSFYSFGTQVAWASPRYRAALVGNDPCPPVERLFYVAGTARVVSGLGVNNLRTAPLRNAEIVGQLAEGDTFAVDSLASICSDGIRWREVQGLGSPAWTAESQGSTYYLEVP